MIQPLKAIASSTMMSRPVALNPQKAYSNTMNYTPMGEKLDYKCNEVRTLTTSGGHKLDIMA